MANFINKEEWVVDEKAKSLTFFSQKQQVSISRDMITELKIISKEKGRVNARFCLHRSPAENLQDMVILEYKDNKCRIPHKHSDSFEAIHLIEGEILTLIFDDDGKLIDRRCLKKEGDFIYRNAINRYHLYFPVTEFAIYREIRDGKFDKKTTLSPEWDYEKSMREHLSEIDMKCMNNFCQITCSLKS